MRPVTGQKSGRGDRTVKILASALRKEPEAPEMTRVSSQPVWFVRSNDFGSGRHVRALVGSRGSSIRALDEDHILRGPQVPTMSRALFIEATINGSSIEEAGSSTSLTSKTDTNSKSHWAHITLLLISEYVTYATLCMPWVYATMGCVIATLTLVINIFLYIAASHVLWAFCMRHPQVRDVVEVLGVLAQGKHWLWQVCKYVTSVYFYAITIAVMAFHIVSGAEYINTVSVRWFPSCKNILLSVLAVIPCFLLSLIRSFPLLSKLSLFAGACTYISLITTCVVLGLQDFTPERGADKGEPAVLARPDPDEGLVECIIAFLTVAFATNASVTVPTFVSDMKDPRDFPKALYLSSAVVLATFAIFGGVIYGLTGFQYMTIPAIGTLDWKWKVVVFSTMLPTIVFLGSLYAAVLARRTHLKLKQFIFRRFPRAAGATAESGWVWTSVLLGLWTAAWFVANLIPFFSGLTSIVAATFVSYFGFVIPPLAWFSMRSVDRRDGIRPRNNKADIMLCIFWICMFIFGTCFMGGLGLYASITSLLDNFQKTGIGRPFACHSGTEASASF